jgi:hypothetical protein
MFRQLHSLGTELRPNRLLSKASGLYAGKSPQQEIGQRAPIGSAVRAANTALAGPPLRSGAKQLGALSLCPERTWYNPSQLGVSATLRHPTGTCMQRNGLAMARCSG